MLNGTLLWFDINTSSSLHLCLLMKQQVCSPGLLMALSLQPTLLRGLIMFSESRGFGGGMSHLGLGLLHSCALSVMAVRMVVDL